MSVKTSTCRRLDSLVAQMADGVTTIPFTIIDEEGNESCRIGETTNCTEGQFEHPRIEESDSKSRLIIVQIETSRLPAKVKVLASLK